MRFLNEAFGFEEAAVLRATTIHPSSSMPRCAGPWAAASCSAALKRTIRRWPAPAPATIRSICVEDPDGLFARAATAGAQVVRGLRDEDYGPRGFTVRDPEGNLWSFGTYRGALRGGVVRRLQPGAWRPARSRSAIGRRWHAWSASAARVPAGQAESGWWPSRSAISASRCRNAMARSNDRKVISRVSARPSSVDTPVLVSDPSSISASVGSSTGGPRGTGRSARLPADWPRSILGRERCWHPSLRARSRRRS